MTPAIVFWYYGRMISVKFFCNLVEIDNVTELKKIILVGFQRNPHQLWWVALKIIIGYDILYL